MDRVISDEEKIRRAIEISQRRNKSYYTRDTARVNVNNKKNYKLFKKMIIQIIICLVIYGIFYMITTTNYAFSEEVVQNTNNILNYDMNIEKMYQEIQGFFITNFNTENEEQNSNVNNQVELDTVNEKENTIENNVSSIKQSKQNVATINTIKEKKEDINKTETKEKTQMEKDAETVKKLLEFTKPLTGRISSEFGAREVTAKFMSADHKGIDIAAKSGTSIKAAMDGTVSVASSNSEYGKFIKIVNGDVMTVYAHCKSLKVKNGDKVKKGKVIATVGSTGNSTGPHLHFEIRLNGRYINPRYVIQF